MCTNVYTQISEEETLMYVETILEYLEEARMFSEVVSMPEDRPRKRIGLKERMLNTEQSNRSFISVS